MSAAQVRCYAIFLLTPEGLVASWNVGAERNKGYRADEIIGRHFSVFYPQEALECDLPAQALCTAVQQGQWKDEGWRLRDSHRPRARGTCWLKAGASASTAPGSGPKSRPRGCTAMARHRAASSASSGT